MGDPPPQQRSCQEEPPPPPPLAAAALNGVVITLQSSPVQGLTWSGAPHTVISTTLDQIMILNKMTFTLSQN